MAWFRRGVRRNGPPGIARLHHRAHRVRQWNGSDPFHAGVGHRHRNAVPVVTGHSTEVIDNPLIRSLRIAVLVVASAVLGTVTIALVRSYPVYQNFSAQMVAFAILVAVAVAEAVLLSAGRSWRGYRWAALGVVLVASALSIFSLPEGAVTTAADWAFGTVGWFLLILLLNQPLAWLLTALGVQEAIQFGAALSGAAGRAELLNLVSGSLGAIGYPLACGIAAGVMRSVVHEAERATRQAAVIRTGDAVAEQVHWQQQDRYSELDATTLPLLQGLADRSLDPSLATVQRACAIEAARMRRLFAETDQVNARLLHELRHCIDIAERRGVVVELATRGAWPDPPRDVRRALTDPAAAVLATAASWARLTVVGTPGAVVVTVVADGSVELPATDNRFVGRTTALHEQTLLVEATWATN